MMSRFELIKMYFLDGFTYEEIMKMLFCRHNIDISLGTVHRSLRRKGLYRKGFPSPLWDVVLFMEMEISSIGCFVGYRAMH